MDKTVVFGAVIETIFMQFCRKIVNSLTTIVLVRKKANINNLVLYTFIKNKYIK